MDDARLAEELNSFYTRFDKYDFSEQQKEVMEEVRCRPSQLVEFSQEAAGPDNISDRTLKESSNSLAPTFTRLF